MDKQQTGKKLKIICIDGEGELNNSLMEEYCGEHGIVIEKITLYLSAAG